MYHKRKRLPVMADEANKLKRLRKLCENGKLRKLFTLASGVQHLKQELDPDRSQPLHYAAARGDVQVVRDLIESYGCDPVCKNVYDITPMHCACYCGQLDVVKYLQKYCPLATRVEDNAGACPVVYTAYCTIYGLIKYYYAPNTMKAPLDYFKQVITPHQNTHIETAKFLLSCMLPEDEFPPTVLFVLRLPIHFGSLPDLKFMISILKPTLSLQKLMEYNREIYNCLGVAIYDKKWDLVECILREFHESIKAVMASGDQVLFHRVCYEADVNLVKLFLELGICESDIIAVKEAFNRNDYDLLSYLLQSAKQPIVMKRYNSEWSSLLSCILSFNCSKRKKLIKLLVAYANNSRDSEGNTVLHLACKHSVPFLVKKNNSYYEQSAKNNSDQLPLHIACGHNNLEIVKLVSSQPRLDVNTKDSEGNTAVHVLCRSILRFSMRYVGEQWKGPKFLKCLEYLVFEKECDVNIQNDVGELPAHILMRNSGRFYCLNTDDEEEVVLMITNRQHFTNVNAQDCDGNTLLHIACKNKAWKIAHYLTTNFLCDVNLPNNDKCLPLHYAIASHRSPFSKQEEADLSMEIVKAVASGCTQIHLRNNSGMTPLHTACGEIKLDIVKHLVFHEKCSPNLIDSNDIYNDLEVHLACRDENDIGLLKALVNKVNVNMPKCKSHTMIGYEQDTPLHFACSCKNLPAIKLLIELNCDCTLKNSQGMLPLHKACSISLECVKLLHVQKDDMKIQDNDGNTPLHWACRRNCTKVVNYLLSNFSCDVTIKNSEGELPLHLSCAGSLETVRMVSNCDTNSQTVKGDTPLHIACKTGVIDVVQYLVNECKCNSSMAKRNKFGKLPIHYACEHSLEMVKLVDMSCTTEALILRPIDCYFVFNLSKMTALDIACSHGLLDIVTFLVNEKHCSLSALKGNQSALGYACGILERETFGVWNDDHTGGIQPHIAEYLITECGYDPTISYQQLNLLKDESTSITPFESACKVRSLHLMKALTVLSVDTIDSKGNTPLHYACKYICTEIAQFLIEHGCSQTIFNNKKELPIHISCYQSLEITQMLKQCDINAQNADGNTPLHIACEHSKEEIVFYLVKEAKCDVNISNRRGDFALHIACRKSVPLAKLLYGCDHCDVNCQDAGGNTALHLVCSSQQYEIVEHLVSNKLCRADIANEFGDLPLHIIMDTHWSVKSSLSSKKHKASTTMHMIEMIFDRHRLALMTPNKDGLTPIHIAFKNGKNYLLEVLLKQNELHFTRKPECYFLHIACTYRQPHIVHWLVDHGADSAITDDEDNLPEHLCISSDSSSLETLIQLSTLDLSKKNKTGDTILHLACKHNQGYILEYILSNNDCSNAFSIKNDDGDTPLHMLAKQVISPDILHLIKFNEPNVKNNNGNTPLHIACHNDNVEFVKLLLTLQSDPKILNDQGELPLHLAAARSLNVLNLVITSENVNAQRNNGDTPLHIACWHQKLDIILHLIKELNCSVQDLNENEESPFHVLLNTESGLNITSVLKFIPKSLKDSKNKKGFTLLHIACMKANVQAASFLVKSLKCSIDVTHKDSGVTPLHFACDRGLMDLVKLVSDCNPRAKVEDTAFVEDFNFTEGDTPLHTACKTGNANIIRYLLKKGHIQALDISNSMKNLPFHFACQHKRGANRRHRLFLCYTSIYPIEKMLARVFVEYKAHFNCSTENISGDTPLHIACRNMPTHPYLKILVNQMKCKTDKVNKAGDLPLHVACQNGVLSQNAVKLLITGLRGDKIGLQNINGNTALHELLKYPGDEHFAENLKLLIQILVERMSNLTSSNNDNKQPVHLACRHHRLNIVEYLCERVYDSVDKLPSAVLYEACLNDNPGVLEYITRKFDYDADVSNADGDLPLHLAVRQERSTPGTIELVKKTVNINYNNLKGNTPLHELYSCNKSRYDRSQVLLAFLKKSTLNLSLKNKIGETPLHCICEACKYEDLKAIVISGKKINPNIQDDKGLTLLHIACKNDDYDSVYLLLSLPDHETDLSIKDSKGQTPITLTKESRIVKLLLDHGADPTPLYDTHKRFFKAYSSETPPQTPMSILVIGNPLVGKTTLIQALRNEHSGNEIVADIFDRTAGVVPVKFSSKIYGDAMFYDFAGHPEYYASHDTIIHSTIKNITPIVLILVNLTDSKKKIRNQTHYWINFVDKRYEVAHIIIVCSHADIFKSDPSIKVSKLQSLIRPEVDGKHLVLKEILYINCTQVHSKEMSKLQKILKCSADELRDEKVMHFNSHCFYALLLQEFKNNSFITFGCISNKLKHMSRDSNENPLYLLPSDQNSVIQMCKDLDGKGHIMFIEHSSIIDLSWLVLDRQPLLHDLVGTLFAPSSFPQHRPLSYSTGVVPLSLFKKHFGELHNYIATLKLTFLRRMEYCREITDKAVLTSIVKQEEYSKTDKYYFFPNLVSLERPIDKWNTDPSYAYKCGWLIQCTMEGDFFSPHFIQALLLRLAFVFVPKNQTYDSRNIIVDEDDSDEEENQAMALVIKRVCSVWKNGIYWRERTGVITIVEIIDQKTLVLLMQCPQGSEVQLIKRRSSIISMVFNARNEFCPRADLIEYFLHPESVKHPFDLDRKMTFSIIDIQNSIKESTSIASGKIHVTNSYDKMVDFETLLYFEPYSELCAETVIELFKEANSHEQVKHDLLLSIATQLKCRYQIFVRLCHTLDMKVRSVAVEADDTNRLLYTLKQVQQRSSRGTYHDLCGFFNQISIFCGRQPPQGL